MYAATFRGECAVSMMSTLSMVVPIRSRGSASHVIQIILYMNLDQRVRY